MVTVHGLNTSNLLKRREYPSASPCRLLWRLLPAHEAELVRTLNIHTPCSCPTGNFLLSQPVGMPPKGSGKAKEGPGRAKAASAKAPAQAAAETVPAKKLKAASAKRPVVSVGTRVRVQCADGEHYEGNVDSWDASVGEWKIVLDDGGPPLPPHLPPAPPA